MSGGESNKNSGNHSTHSYPPNYPPQAYPPHGFFPYRGIYPPPPQQQGAYPFMGYPHEYPGFNFQGLSGPSTGDNESESSPKTEDKKSQIRWNMTMDNVLFDMLVEATKAGKKKGKRWDNVVWVDLSATLSGCGNGVIEARHIENRLRQMKGEFTSFVELKNKSGVSYDPVKQMVLASTEFWNEILSHPKQKKKFKSFQERGLKWDFEKLSTVLGDSYATGLYSQMGMDEVERIEVEDVEKSIDVEDEENAEAEGTKVPPKRKHGKISRPIDELKDLLEGVTSRIDMLVEKVDPLTFPRQLREAVMGVQGFNKYLQSAFKFLMKDKMEAEIFLVSDEEAKKDILDELRGLLGTNE